ncbi:hypothetical protein AXF35_11060 [Legionella pneumophila subsp. pascullei]|nr:hypothetical protein AXF35_11060 [Legionella pneumophila subsp. pascullei]AMP92134.1 hypothetical protein AXF36_05740 [Legionella pneumophila subsp. pascullei]AMP95100.1 hypothetical protein AXF37_05630 [Legionella pneumophila subsp. pascullei]
MIVGLKPNLYQANTVRDTTVASITFLEIHILRNLDYYQIRKKGFINVFDSITEGVMDWEEYDCTNI